MSLPIVVLRGVDLAYCDVCGRPEAVGIFNVAIWQYNVLICSGCLTKFAETITQKGSKLLQGTLKVVVD